MAIGRTIEAALLKAVRSLEIGTVHLGLPECKKADDRDIIEKLIYAEDDRLFYLYEAMKRGYTDEELVSFTQIDPFFLDKIRHICEIEEDLAGNQTLDALKTAKEAGFHDQAIAAIWNTQEETVRALRHENKLLPVYKMVDTCAAEFAASTPYFYSTYEEENESIVTEKQKVIVLGSGPIRIGQGIEFDYATVHSIRAIQKMGYEAIVINSNPETVSTDFSVADKLYFEPLTTEDVLGIVAYEKPMGVIVQFGGQTAINLAKPLEEAGVSIIGTRLEDLDRAENRDLFEAALQSMNIRQPLGASATSVSQAVTIAERIGYPVLVRPSYVLGGRAMQIVYNRKELEMYMKEAVEASQEHPVLIDRYIQGKECDVDALCDGTDVLIPGIMEHVERSGIHSGDSMAIYPAQSFSEAVIEQIVAITTQLALGLNCIGIMNVQFVIQDETVYVIEVNPRASRTVPFLSKVTNIPMAQVATRILLKQSLKEQGYPGGLAPLPKRISVKAPVFSFEKLHRVDAYLGPEMKSTGEVMGSDVTVEKALYKAFVASGMQIPSYGKVLITLDEASKHEAMQLVTMLSECGFHMVATEGTAQHLEEAGVSVERIEKLTQSLAIIEQMKHKEIVMVINTMGEDKEANSDGYRIRKASIEYHVPLFTSLDTASAIARVMLSQNFSAERVGV